MRAITALMLAVAVILSGCSDSDDADTAGADGDEGEEAGEVDAGGDFGGLLSVDPPPDDEILGVGDTASFDDWEFTLVSRLELDPDLSPEIAGDAYVFEVQLTRTADTSGTHLDTLNWFVYDPTIDDIAEGDATDCGSAYTENYVDPLETPIAADFEPGDTRVIPDCVPLSGDAAAGTLLSVKAIDPEDISVIGETWFDVSA